MKFRRVFSAIAGVMLLIAVAPAALHAQAKRTAAYGGIVPPAPVPAVRPLKMADFPGRWIGTGELRFVGGLIDQMTCRITYIRSEPTHLKQSIRCQSKNLKLEIKTRIVDFPRGEITGEWRDFVYDIAGRISGRIHGNVIRAAVSGRTLNAALNVVLDGNKQTIELIPRNSMIRSMRIKLARG